MKRKLLYTAVALWINTAAFAQVTKMGNDTLLDVGGWNVEWFGNTSNGPSDEALQYANVKAVLKNTDIDVWGLAEISNPTTFATLLTELPEYDGVSSSFSQTQKTAFIWKKSKFDVVSSGNVLTESTYSYDFASRPPLEIVLKSKDNNITDTLYFYVLHLKANTGTQTEKVESYNRRKNAAAFLKTYLDTNRKNKKVFVLGDWNDDLDESIVYENSAYLPSPFLNFLNDSTHYLYATLQLTKTGKQSTASYSNMIDHQMISGYMRDSFYVANSSMVMTQTAGQITGYKDNTSDHYPVLARYNMKRYFKPGPPPAGMNELSAAPEVRTYPNPATHSVHIETSFAFNNVSLVNMVGEVVAETTLSDLNVTGLTNGMYFLHVTGETGTAISKLLIHH